MTLISLDKKLLCFQLVALIPTVHCAGLGSYIHLQSSAVLREVDVFHFQKQNKK